ncbi:hypothetical protein L1987_02597 [Smallanthus sonchifolius]|uniref:Uncharacterized protein n=1 Tax=Smallanthus sonchifolius TaxID=185202 RepID=A0ACB9K857_9ASTR|nr:hypothetical protein L1987_02597 [Smallanthus sonchifolius]
MSNQGVTVIQEIMVPLVGTPQAHIYHNLQSLNYLNDRYHLKFWFQTAGIRTSNWCDSRCSNKESQILNLQIAKEAEFFSFGTNDLTQMTFGYNRDDVGKFLLVYLSQGIYNMIHLRVPIARLAATQVVV